MKEIKLIEIQLDDWRSISQKVRFGEDVTRISGVNGCGKSSIYHAWLWLLTSYTDSENGKNTSLFDRRQEITTITPPASVTATIDIDGSRVTLRRTASPAFTRDRESGELVKSSSDKYRFFINDMEVKATAYNDWISDNICDSEKLRYCLDGTFFANLTITDRAAARTVLEGIVGDIKDSDYSQDYSEIERDLAMFNPEEIAAYARKKIKISEQDISIINAKKKDMQGLFTEEDEARMSEISSELLLQSEELSSILRSYPSDEVNRITTEIQNKSIELINARDAYNLSISNERQKISKRILEVDSRNAIRMLRQSETRSDIEKFKADLLTAENSLGMWVLQRERIIEERDAIKSRTFNSDGLCALCHQPLPDGDIEKMKEEFLRQNASDLASVVKRGKDCAKTIEEKQAEITRIKNMIAEYSKDEELESTEPLQNELREFEANLIAFEDTDDGKKLAHEIQKLKDELQAIIQSVNDISSDRRKEIKKREEELYAELYALEDKKQKSACFSELEDEAKRLSNVIAHNHKVIHLCNNRIYEKADIVSHRINDLLKDFRISMWTEMKSGALSPDCIIQDMHGVHYATLNTAHRLKACLEMQKLFRDAYGIKLPTFVDEASIFDNANMPKGDGQIIYLFASDSKKLIVE